MGTLLSKLLKVFKRREATAHEGIPLYVQRDGRSEPKPTKNKPHQQAHQLIPTAPKEEEEVDEDLAALRQRCGRFRVLIIGKANAGKTTILHKMCNTTVAPIIHDKDGKLLDATVLEPTDGRGIHDINNELTFSSSSGFVFHDSRGFEANSVKELEDVREFIARHAGHHNLKDQLHAIWYCLPVDNDRPLTNAEMSFFEQGTGRVPVIAIFTKYDGLILKEYTRLRFEEGYERPEARRLALTLADKIFRESDHYLKRVQSAPHPPTRHLRLQDMQEPGTTCAELSQQTVEALDSDKLRALFVSVQHNNLDLCTFYAIKIVVIGDLKKADTKPPMDMKGMETLASKILCYYTHLFALEQAHDYHVSDEFHEEFHDTEIGHFYESHFLENLIIPVVKPVLPTLTSESTYPLQVLKLSIAILILCEDSFWVFNTSQATERLKVALDNYMETSRAGVIQAVDEAFYDVDTEALATIGERDMLQMVLGIVQKFKAEH